MMKSFVIMVILYHIGDVHTIETQTYANIAECEAAKSAIVSTVKNKGRFVVRWNFDEDDINCVEVVDAK